MTIRFEQVVPTYLEPEKIQRSEIWNQTLSFEPGQKIHIVAPSGSGKTSLVHFLYRMRSDYNGRILFNKEDIRQYQTESLAAVRSSQISVIFQDLRLFFNHTVRENIEVKRALNPYHLPERINEMCAELGIAAKLDKPLRTCSYGEQQRIAIIRALQQPFSVLLMDEPFSHLDEQNRSKAMQLIESEATKRNATLVLADLKRIDYFHHDRILHL
jgi:putative ABC transport system ATP-binding protein